MQKTYSSIKVKTKQMTIWKQSDQMKQAIQRFLYTSISVYSDFGILLSVITDNSVIVSLIQGISNYCTENSLALMRAN